MLVPDPACRRRRSLPCSLSHLYLACLGTAVSITTTVEAHLGAKIAATRVTFRTGPRTSSGERVASKLVLTLGQFESVIDNARCFANSSFLEGGSVLLFGDLPVYVATMPEDFPWEIVSFANSLPSAGSTLAAPRNVEVIVAVSVHGRRPTLEHTSDIAGTSTPQHGKVVVEEFIEELLSLVDLGEKPDEAVAKMEVV